MSVWVAVHGRPGQSSARRLGVLARRLGASSGRAGLLAASAELRSSVGETQFVGSVLQLFHHVLMQVLPWPVAFSAVSL